MNKLPELIGIGAGALGILICLLAGLIRLAGAYRLLGYEAMTLFNVGVGLMVLACLLKLYRPGAR